MQVKCQMCNKNPAVILIHQTINNKKKEINLCETCAFMSGFIEEKNDNIEFNLSKFILSGLTFREKDNKTSLRKTCPVCGTTLLTINKEKRCGCSECYTVFRRELKRKFRKYYKVTVHKGKYPKRLKIFKKYLFDIRELKEKLKTAIKVEDYESAAALRDKISILTNTD